MQVLRVAGSAFAHVAADRESGLTLQQRRLGDRGAFGIAALSVSRNEKDLIVPPEVERAGLLAGRDRGVVAADVGRQDGGEALSQAGLALREMAVRPATATRYWAVDLCSRNGVHDAMASKSRSIASTGTCNRIA